MPYKVFVDDNFNSLFSAEDRYEFGEFATYEEAVEKAKDIVDRSLRSQHKHGMTCDQLYEQYTAFGDDPWLKPVAPAPDIQPRFSAWQYAKSRCQELCGAPAIGALDMERIEPQPQKDTKR